MYVWVCVCSCVCDHNTYWSIDGTANWPEGVIIAPGTEGPSTGIIKLRGIPVLLRISVGS